MPSSMFICMHAYMCPPMHTESTQPNHLCSHFKFAAISKLKHLPLGLKTNTWCT